MSQYEVIVTENVTYRWTVEASSSEAAETLVVDGNAGEPRNEYVETSNVRIEKLA